MDKFKIIQLSSSSSSHSVADYEEDIYRGWYAQLAFQIKKFRPESDVECWTPEKEYNHEKKNIKDDVTFRIFPTNISIRHGMEISLRMINALRQEIRESEEKKRSLILHIHEYHSWQVYLILFFLKKTKNIKVISQHHGGRSPLNNLMKYKRLILFLPVIILMQFFENLLFKKIDIFYALGDKEAEYLKKIAQKSKIKFQTMGIDEKYFKTISKNLARKNLGLKINQKYILYIGRIKTTKGIKELLDAMKEIDAELLLIGDGPDKNKYEDYAKRENITNIKFLGAIYSDKKLDYLSACDCLILPSYTEGAPVVLMEAIARNLPVIATDVGGVKNMIENGREGIIIKPKSNEEIKKAINEILKWKKKNFKEYAKKYKWEQIIKETLEDYENGKKES